MDLTIFIVFFILTLFFVWIGKKDFDGLNSGYLIACILLIVFGFLLLDTGIQVENGVLVNRTGSEITSLDLNYMSYTSSNNGFVMVLAFLCPFIGFIGILLFIGHIILRFIGK